MPQKFGQRQPQTAPNLLLKLTKGNDSVVSSDVEKV